MFCWQRDKIKDLITPDGKENVVMEPEKFQIYCIFEKDKSRNLIWDLKKEKLSLKQSRCFFQFGYRFCFHFCSNFDIELDFSSILNEIAENRRNKQIKRTEIGILFKLKNVIFTQTLFNTSITEHINWR